MEWILGVTATILSGVAVAGIVAMIRKFNAFVIEQRKVNERNREFERSMQRAEINRYFQRVVEDGIPISPEEMAHLDSCYKAYHANGGNGVGTLMYEKILENSKIVTKIKLKEDE